MNIDIYGLQVLGPGVTAEVSFNQSAPFGVLLLVRSGENVSHNLMLNAGQASELGSILMGAAMHAGRAAERAGGWHS